MEEHRFRIYDTKRKEWLHDTEHAVNLLGEIIVYGEILRRPDGTAVSLLELNDLVVMQFTGFKDKNDKEMYFGDLFFHTGFPDVVFEIERSKFGILGTPVRLKYFEIGYCGGGHLKENDWLFSQDMEIIGNKFDNPELIKKENSGTLSPELNNAKKASAL